MAEAPEIEVTTSAQSAVSTIANLVAVPRLLTFSLVETAAGLARGPTAGKM